MIYIVEYSIDGEFHFQKIDNEGDLTVFIGKLKGIGKDVKITLYRAEQINFKFTLENKTETIITKIPKVEIL